MSHHHIYHTQAIVLSSRNTGEANKYLTLYTRELGLVRASAQGVRLAQSKLRYGLQDFSYANIDLVRGRDIWRVTSSVPIDSFPFLRRQEKSLSLIFKVSKLIERLCAGEEANEKIFDALTQVFYLLDDEKLDDKNREAMELYLVFRIVYELGYVGETKNIIEYLGEDFDNSNIDLFLQDKSSIIAHINKALRESHL